MKKISKATEGLPSFIGEKPKFEQNFPPLRHHQEALRCEDYDFCTCHWRDKHGRIIPKKVKHDG